jgi:hypothetical protein
MSPLYQPLAAVRAASMALHYMTAMAPRLMVCPAGRQQSGSAGPCRTRKAVLMQVVAWALRTGFHLR